MSARAIGEGHLSCVEFRTGVIGPAAELRVDQPSPHASTGRCAPRATSYSCGGLVHGDVLVIPCGFGDMGIEFATVPVSGLLERLEGH